MDLQVHRIRTPVRREGAERHVLLSLVSFGATVVLVRLFLQLTGFPQLGNSTLHIAHALWGGLLLFIAALLSLIFANRWTYNAGALLSGIGVGLFIDEVGKFITQNNDYFYPPAAAIIYGFFLLVVVIYLRVRRPPSQNPRAELYCALDGLTEVLDRDLDPHEYAALETRLQYVVRAGDDPNLTTLATALLEFMTGVNPPAQASPGFLQREEGKVQTVERRLIGRRRLKALLVVGLGLFGLLALMRLSILLVVTLAPAAVPQPVITQLMTIGAAYVAKNEFWFLIRLALEGGVGALYLVAAGLLLAGRERRGIGLGILSLLASLAVVNLLVFYLDQSRAFLNTLLQLGLLLVAIGYRRQYLRGR
jgi:hypothetical protein